MKDTLPYDHEPTFAEVRRFGGTCAVAVFVDGVFAGYRPARWCGSSIVTLGTIAPWVIRRLRRDALREHERQAARAESVASALATTRANVERMRGGGEP